MDFLRHQTVTYDDAKNSKEMFLLFLKGKGNLLLRDLLLGGKPTGRKSGGECLQQFYDIWWVLLHPILPFHIIQFFHFTSFTYWSLLFSSIELNICGEWDGTTVDSRPSMPLPPCDQYAKVIHDNFALFHSSSYWLPTIILYHSATHTCEIIQKGWVYGNILLRENGVTSTSK